MDSSGVAALVHGRKQARVAGGELLLAAPQPQVLRLLTLTRLIDVFRVCTSVDEAARSVIHFPRVAVPVAQWRLGNSIIKCTSAVASLLRIRLASGS